MKKIIISILLLLILITALVAITPTILRNYNFVSVNDLQNAGINSSDDNNDGKNKSSASSSRVKNKKYKIFIDAGHNAKTAGGIGPVGAEYIINYKLSLLLADRLSKDKMFEYEISRDISNYTESIMQFGQTNKDVLTSIIKTSVPWEKRSSPLGFAQYLEIYSVRHYAIDNDFDFLISVHFDTIEPRFQKMTEGFHVIVSPYNRRFEESMRAAEIISSNMREQYSPSRWTRHDGRIPESMIEQYDKKERASKGISIRSLMIIGDVFEDTYFNNRYDKDKEFIQNISDIPSVILETGYLHEMQFTNDVVLNDVADRIYKSIKEILN